jgi:hypothetical protein
MWCFGGKMVRAPIGHAKAATRSKASFATVGSSTGAASLEEVRGVVNQAQDGIRTILPPRHLKIFKSGREIKWLEVPTIEVWVGSLGLFSNGNGVPLRPG